MFNCLRLFLLALEIRDQHTKNSTQGLEVMKRHKIWHDLCFTRLLHKWEKSHQITVRALAAKQMWEVIKNLFLRKRHEKGAVLTPRTGNKKGRILGDPPLEHKTLLRGRVGDFLKGQRTWSAAPVTLLRKKTHEEEQLRGPSTGTGKKQGGPSNPPLEWVGWVWRGRTWQLGFLWPNGYEGHQRTPSSGTAMKRSSRDGFPQGQETWRGESPGDPPMEQKACPRGMYGNHPQHF